MPELPTPQECVDKVFEAPDKEAFRYFLLFVKTIDEHDPGYAKPFPIDQDHAYLLEIADVLMTEPVSAVEKARQMLFTHLLTARTCYAAIRYPGSRLFVQSKGEKEAEYIIETRAKFLLEHLPKGIFFDGKPHCTRRPPELKIKRNGIESVIFGIPQGGDKIRSYTCTGGFSDEAAFQPEFEDALSAALPSIAGGGWHAGGSTANGKEAWYRHLHGGREDEN